jgi:hypothetical protein
MVVLLLGLAVPAAETYYSVSEGSEESSRIFFLVPPLSQCNRILNVSVEKIAVGLNINYINNLLAAIHNLSFVSEPTRQ